MKWRYVAVVLAVVIAVVNSYLIGKRTGETDAKLSHNQALIHVSDSVTRSDSAKVDTAKKNDAILTAYRGNIRKRITVSKDTITVQSDDSSPPHIVVDSTLAHLVQADDSALRVKDNHIGVLEAEVASLRAGISLRDDRIKLLESQHAPRISQGIQVGVGYCQTPTGQTPCAYVGYGFSLRIK